MNNPLSMKAVEFEIFVRRYLEGLGGSLKEFRTQHLETIEGTDGDYVFDVTARFEALGTDFLVLVECKRYTSDRVERAEVQVLNQKKASVGAHKAMLFTTSTFRKGAIDMATVHGIALIEVRAKEVNYVVKSWNPDFTGRVVVPESVSMGHYLFGSSLSVRLPDDAVPEEAGVQEFVITILRERLDYLRIVASKGYAVDAQEIEALETEIAEEGAKLDRMLRR
jgi:restriction system protein